MLLFQQIKFKNDKNGNGRSIVQVYEKKIYYSVLIDTFKSDGLEIEQALNENGYPYKKLVNSSILPTIYNWMPYSSYK